jgi:hypothetical protein
MSSVGDITYTTIYPPIPSIYSAQATGPLEVDMTNSDGVAISATGPIMLIGHEACIQDDKPSDSGHVFFDTVEAQYGEGLTQSFNTFSVSCQTAFLKCGLMLGNMDDTKDTWDGTKVPFFSKTVNGELPPGTVYVVQSTDINGNAINVLAVAPVPVPPTS